MEDTSQDIANQCTRIIDGHAHREAIRESDLRLWVREVVAAHGSAAVWHATRAGGFGGSEIGVLVRNHAGVRADHQASAHDIVEGKLLRRLPLEDSGHLRRGHDNEARHAQWFAAKYGATRDEASFQRLASATGMRQWMRYSPDELALLPLDHPNPALDGAKAARWLVDYKAPSVVDDSEEIKFQYACQLHQGALICAAQGIHLDGLMLSQFDWAGWRLKDDHVAYDADLSAMILQAGDHYWAYVLRGEVPAYVAKPRFEGEIELRKQWEVAASRIARLKAMARAIETLLEPEEQALREHMKSMYLGDARCTVGDLSISAVQVVDMQAVIQVLPDDPQGERALRAMAKASSSLTFDAKLMEEHLRRLGVPMKQFARARLDHAKVYQWALEHKLDPHTLFKEQVRLIPSKGLELQARDMARVVFGKAEEADTPSQAHESGQDDRQGPENTGRTAPRSVTA